MNPEIVQSQSWRYKTIVVIKGQQQTTTLNKRWTHFWKLTQLLQQSVALLEINATIAAVVGDYLCSSCVVLTEIQV